MNLSKELKKRRDAEERQRKSSPNVQYIEGTGYIDLSKLASKDHTHTFLDLTDTPASYETMAGKVVKVKVTEDGLEFGEGSGTIEQATETVLGGVKAAAKTSVETQEVKIDTATGKLYTAPSGSGGSEAFRVNLAFGKSYTKSVSPATSYPDTNNTEMTDGRKSETTVYSNAMFTGWQNTSVDIVVDLASELTIHRGVVFGLSSTSAGVYIPLSVEVLTSSDNITFTSQKLVNPTLITGVAFYAIIADFADVNARYVKFVITRQTGKEWLFLDEIEVW